MSKIRIDALQPTVAPGRDHEFAGMRDGISNKIRIEQILGLLQSSDIPDDAITLAKLAADAKDIPQTRADIASATTTDIGAASTQYLRVTGTTTITGIGTAAEGVVRDLLFADALTLTHNATSLILPGGADITTAAGDVALFRSEGAGNWRCVRYQRADGTAVVAPPPPETGFICRAWVNFDGTLATGNIRASGNVSSVVRNGTGDYTVNFTNAISDANYATQVNCSERTDQGGSAMVGVARDKDVPRTTTAFRLMTRYGSNDTTQNVQVVSVAVFR